MNLPETTHQEIITAEICEEYFPSNAFVAQSHRDSFNDSLFEYYVGEDKNPNEWEQIIVGNTNGCDTIFMSDGEVFFYNPTTKQMIETNEIHVVTIDNVNIISNGELDNIDMDDDIFDDSYLEGIY